MADALVAWSASHGVTLQRAVVAPVANRGNGVIATEAISKGDLVLRVPHTMILTANDDNDEANAVGQTNALALALLHERRLRASKWSPFIAALPRAFRTPLFFNESERRLLRGTDVLGWARVREANPQDGRFG